MGELFKVFGGLASPLKLKLVGLLAAALLLTNAINWFVTSRIYYAKGENTAKVELANYQRKVTELQLKVNNAAGVVKTQVITKYVDRVQTVDKIVYKNGETITKYVSVPTDVNGQEVMVPAGWVYAHNQAALGLPIDPVKAQDAIPTKVSFRTALTIIAENYGTYQKLVAKDKAWQEYYKGLQQVYENYKNTEIKLDAKK
jgi:hypothetical protein